MVRAIVRQTERKKENWKTKIANKLDEYTFAGSDRDHFYELCTGKLEKMKGKMYRKALDTDKTKILLKNMEDSVIQGSNFIFLINGSPFSGKSRMAQSLMFINKTTFKRLGVEYPVEVGFRALQIMKILARTRPPYGLVRDENPNESGEDSQLRGEASKSIVEIIRQKQVSVATCTPIKGLTQFVNNRLEMCGTNPKTGMLRAFLFHANEKYPSGIIEIPYHGDDEFFNEYKNQKDKFLDNMLETGGQGLQEFDKEKFDAVINEYYPIVLEEFELGMPVSKVDIRDYLEELGFRETESFKRKVSGKLNRMVRKEHNRLKNEMKKEKNTNILEKPQADKDPIMKWKDLDFPELVYTFFPKDVTELEINVYAAICAKEGFRAIAKRFFGSAKNTKKVYEIKKKIQENFLGEAAEKAKEFILIKEGKKVERIGGNTDKPDLINHTDKVVISFKCYTFLNDTKAKKEIGVAHVQAALELGYNCVEEIFCMEESTFYKYRVSLPGLTKNTIKKEDQTPPYSIIEGNTPSSFPSSSSESLGCESGPPRGMEGDEGRGVSQKTTSINNINTKKKRRRR